MKPGPDGGSGIYTGDARALMAGVPDGSVDLVFTDPVYGQIEDYLWLSGAAARVLKPDGALLAWGSIKAMDAEIGALTAHLNWRWLLTWYQSNNMRIYSPVFNKYQICYWLDRDGGSRPSLFQDLRNEALSVGAGRQDRHHKWAKHTNLISYWMTAFVNPGALVLDPFAGGGSVPAVCKQLGMRYLAFEIDEDTAARARERVQNTQTPLFTPGGAGDN